MVKVIETKKKRKEAIVKRTRTLEAKKRAKEFFAISASIFFIFFFVFIFKNIRTTNMHYLFLLVLIYAVIATIIAIGMFHFYNMRLPWQK